MSNIQKTLEQQIDEAVAISKAHFCHKQKVSKKWIILSEI